MSPSNGLHEETCSINQELVPLIEVTRGPLVESRHLGAIAVVDARGQLVAQAGSPDLVAYLRSTAKPLQALALLESGAADAFGFSPEELAIACGSHSGSDQHAALVLAMLARLGLDENALQCGAHVPGDRDARQRLQRSGARATPARHNCSGKHTAMLAGAVMTGRAPVGPQQQAGARPASGAPTADYLDPAHPVQQQILAIIAEMSGVARERIPVAVDGCSAPTFALPLRHAAWAFARLLDPAGLPEPRARACRRIVAAMQAAPVMVAGAGELDTVLIDSLRPQLISKGGAEGFCGMGLAPGALGPGAPALGIAFKTIDGNNERTRGPIAVELLRQLGLFVEPPEPLRAFARPPVTNYRGILVGEVRPAFTLVRSKEEPPR